MVTPPREIQALLFSETLGLLASYSWQSTVTLEPTEFGRSDVDLTLPEFFREFRLRHAIATAERLRGVVSSIESNPSHISDIERTESRGVIRGRLDTPLYLARRATLRSLPRRYPVIRSRVSYGTPENILTRLALAEVRTAMRDNPFSPGSAEGASAAMHLHWVTDRLMHRPWDEIIGQGLQQRLYNEVDARTRRRQTGNDDAYRRLLCWYDKWSLDLHHLGEAAREDVINGLLAFPANDAFWDKVFEVWCLLFTKSALDSLAWTRIEGPLPLHEASGVIYTYRTSPGRVIKIRFQRSDPLPIGRWRYRNASPLRGIPDIIISGTNSAPFPLLIDAKNRYVFSEQITRSEETYKMLGYAENFAREKTSRRFRGILVFPGSRTIHRIIDGPEDSRLDLIAIDLRADRSSAIAALADAVSSWDEALQPPS